MKTLSMNEEMQNIVKEAGLQHIAIIMDGNRRWAKQKNLPTAKGHSEGANSLKKITRISKEWGIKNITVYAFSTENWGRKPEEVDFLMMLMAQSLKNEINDMHKQGVKVTVIGDKSKLNKELLKVIKNSEEKTAENTGVHLQIAINYGSKNEILHSVKQIAEKVKNGEMNPDDISEETISDYLYTAGVSDPDLVIRTGGEMRLSNYLLWQLAYAEIYVTETLWPDFNENSLKDAIVEFARRNRRFGLG